MNGEPIYVSALGASTVVGRHAWSTAAAVRAGISGFVQHPYMIDAAGEPMHAAIAPWLDVDLTGISRFESLLFPAIDQALAALLDAKAAPVRLALSLGLPPARPGLATDLQSSIMKAITARYRGIFMATAAFQSGHAAGLLALGHATKRMAQEAVDACVVASVDSYIEPETLDWLEECDQLHGGGPRNNPWGFIPGEGAGAILLVRGNVIERLGLNVVSRVLGFGQAFEPKRIKTETVCIGEGLTSALRAALRSLPDRSKITDIYCDLNCEPYRADEYGFASLRVGTLYDDDFVCQTPADCLGDVGAASGTLFVLLASIAAAKQYNTGPVALIFCGSEGGDRCAAVLYSPTAERKRTNA